MSRYTIPAGTFMKPIEFLLRPLVQKYRRGRNIAYGKHPRQMLDVYSPNKNAENLPVIIFYYGGSWIRGTRQGYSPVGASLAKLGYVVVVPDYRLFPDAKFPDFVIDGAKSVAWVKQNIEQFNGNPDKINIVGHSAGGMIGALLSVDESYLKNAGLDVTTIKKFVGLAGSYNSPLTSKLFMQIFPDRPKNPPFRAVNVIKSNSVDMLLIHGRRDKLISAEESVQMAEAYQKANGRAELRIMPGLAHAGVMLTIIWPLNKLRPKINNLILSFIN